MFYEARDIPEVIAPAQVKRCAKIEAELINALVVLREAKLELILLGQGRRADTRKARQIAAQIYEQERAAETALARTL